MSFDFYWGMADYYDPADPNAIGISFDAFFKEWRRADSTVAHADALGIFNMYDWNKDGYLGREEFEQFYNFTQEYYMNNM